MKVDLQVGPIFFVILTLLHCIIKVKLKTLCFPQMLVLAVLRKESSWFSSFCSVTSFSRVLDSSDSNLETY